MRVFPLACAVWAASVGALRAAPVSTGIVLIQSQAQLSEHCAAEGLASCQKNHFWEVTATCSPQPATGRGYDEPGFGLMRDQQFQ